MSGLVAKLHGCEASGGCEYKSPCSLGPLVKAGLVAPGDGVLSVCFKGQLFFADVLADGRLRAASADGPITLDHPCALVRVVRASLGSTAAAIGSARRCCHYKGQSLDDVAEASRRQTDCLANARPKRGR